MAAYATVAQFRLLAPMAQAFVNMSDAQISATLEDNSRLADGYLMRKFRLPLISWQGDLTRKIIDLSAWDLMVTRGYNPETQDAVLETRYRLAMKWLEGIPNNTTPMVIDSSGSTEAGTNALTPTVSTAVQRGFSDRPVQPTTAGAGQVPGDFVGT
jgi:phage gp36-like protein